ncbi:MAG: PEP-utilizing enzyme [Candidatus ainarchaeum sp.]|nr:PEP-utilizing enzyme [Candidatus ainarchaeum sp.]MDD3975729.1 PEP-utilizing enzyme [Candidatus ainarchaeum sp.]
MKNECVYKGDVWVKSNNSSISGRINNLDNLKYNEILVIDYVLPVHFIKINSLNPLAIIVSNGGLLSHATIIAQELNIPLIFKPSFVKNYRVSNINVKIDFVDNFAYIFV